MLVDLVRQQPTSIGDKVKLVDLPLHLKKRLLESYSPKVVRTLYVGTSVDPQLFADISKCFGHEQDSEVPSRPQDDVPSRKYTDVHQGMQVFNGLVVT